MFTITNWTDVNSDKLDELYDSESEKVTEQKNRVSDLKNEEAHFEPSMSIGEFQEFAKSLDTEEMMLIDAKRKCKNIRRVQEILGFIRIAYRRGMQNLEHSAMWRIDNVDEIMGGISSKFKLMSDEDSTRDGNAREWHLDIEVADHTLYVTMYHGLQDGQTKIRTDIEKISEMLSDPDQFNDAEFTKMETVKMIEREAAEEARRAEEEAEAEEERKHKIRDIIVGGLGIGLGVLAAGAMIAFGGGDGGSGGCDYNDYYWLGDDKKKGTVTINGHEYTQRDDGSWF